MRPGGQGLGQAIEAAVGQVAAQHQPQARRSGRHRGRADRDPQQAGQLQMALQVEGQGVIAHGKLNDSGVFVADEVLAKHDENYMPPEVAATLKKPQADGGAS